MSSSLELILVLEQREGSRLEDPVAEVAPPVRLWQRVQWQ